MSSSSSDLWLMLHARDTALLATNRAYTSWIESLEQQLVGTKEYLAKVETDRAETIQKIEQDREERLQSIRALQENLDQQGLALHTAQARAAELEQSLQGTRNFLAAVEADSAARLKAIEQMQKQLEDHGRNRHVAEARVVELEQALQGSRDYLTQVEKDRAASLSVIEEQRAKLDEFTADLERKTMYIEQLENAQKQAQAHTGSNQATLQRDLPAAEKHPAEPTVPAVPMLPFNSLSRAANIRSLVIAKFHPRLLPLIVQMGSAGVAVEIFECPPSYSPGYQGNLHFIPSRFIDWLNSIETFFNEQVYLTDNPDAAVAVATGSVRSGWEHFCLLGQHSGRPLGFPYFGGTAEFDAIACDQDDAASVFPHLRGRCQQHTRLIVTQWQDDPLWREMTTHREFITPSTVLFHRLPGSWHGPYIPTHWKQHPNWPRLRPIDLYPPRTPAGGEWPLISVVTVSYNQASFIEETLRSVIAQGYPNLEYIVVDGGSTDGSAEIIKRYASHLSWWISERDGGQSEALNKGFRRARGEILTWLNSDDRLAPGCLFQVATTYLNHRPDLIVGRCARIMDPDLRPNHLHGCKLPLGEVTRLPLARLLDLDGAWLQGHFFHQPEVFFTRDIFDRAGSHVREDLYYSMDYDLWVRMAKAQATVLTIPEVIAIFRQHGAQKTGGNDLPYLPELRTVNAGYLAENSTPA